ncbi:hypothetical protein [Laspinema olomoucense]|uniref:CRISPR type III-B/RAMP module-associated protein Cmr5 n=1 Tax=Laspinema olomoucense D3b TaxID=2953688 RepID=A0ABT2N4T9_9CYAN|nr:hypothetical protein [Laspinema sp. D3b]MCT7977597.1 hypothetical protein [Laspinema sp. D3b]
MPVQPYELDREVFNLLNPGVEQLKDWQGAASGIADYVASWGVERFWAMSRSQRLLGGQLPNAAVGSEQERRYFAWSVARVALCKIAGTELAINPEMNTDQFQTRFRQLNFNQQVLLTDLLMEISETIQFWTMRLKDAKESNTVP